MKRLLIFLFLFFLSIEVVYAIGIGPPRVELYFEPNKIEKIDFVVLNTGDRATDVVVEARGELADLVSFSEERFHLEINENKPIQVAVNMPERIDTPGSNIIRIRAVETSVGQGGTVGAVAGVEAKINLFVPYERAFIRADLDVPHIAVGQNLAITLTVENIGRENISRLSGRFEVVDGTEIILQEQIEGVSLQVKEKKEIKTELQTSELPAGLYTLRAFVEYAGQTKTIEGGFGIGDVFINVVGLVEDIFRVGEIVKLEFRVMSRWNEGLNGFADVSILDGKTEVASIQSPQYSFKPWEESTVEVFWDARGETAGDYVARIDLSYGDDKHTVKEFDITLQKTANILPVLVVLVILIFIMLAGWLLWKRKRSQTSSSSL